MATAQPGISVHVLIYIREPRRETFQGVLPSTCPEFMCENKTGLHTYLFASDCFVNLEAETWLVMKRPQSSVT